MSPGAFHTLTRHPECSMILLLVCLHRLIVVLLLRIEGIDIAELEETQILALAVHVVLDALQTTEEQGLAHHIEVA